jgi:hypothetical protein
MSTILIECPHCLGDVLPMADGRCPSCLADTRESSVEGGTFTKASLRHRDQRLPGVCLVCGAPTERRSQFSQKAKNQRYATNAQGGAIGLLLTWMFDYLSGKMYQEVALDVPHCDECQRRGRELRVRHVDFESRIVTFIVHRNFRTALDSLSRQ